MYVSYNCGASMRTLNISEQLLASALESKQRTKTFETGLLLAHHGAKVDTVLRLVPTPSADGKSAATALDAAFQSCARARSRRKKPLSRGNPWGAKGTGVGVGKRHECSNERHKVLGRKRK